LNNKLQPALGIVARRLREARESAGISQRQLGIDAGWEPSVASPRINQYERGRHAPDVRTLTRLGHILDRPLAYFFAEENDLAEIIVVYCRASATQRKKFLSLVTKK
jgi:transcriptional regulator with XRE-family HTH domain